MRDLRMGFLISALLVLHQYSIDGQAVVNFDTSTYIVNSGEAMSVCLTINNGNFLANNYEVEIGFKGSSLPHFPDQNYKRLTIHSESYCFELRASKPLITDSENNYILYVKSLDSNIMVTGQVSEVPIKVNNYSISTLFRSKDLMFIGFDNEINSTGADKFIFMNAVPITKGMTFTLCNAIPDSSGLFYIPGIDSVLTSFIIKYSGSVPIDPFSKISFQIVNNVTPTTSQAVGNFTVNSLPSTDFTVQLLTAGSPSINVPLFNPVAISLISGYFNPVLDNKYFLVGNLIDALAFHNEDFSSSFSNIINVLQNGSSYGFIKCNNDIYLCEFIDASGEIINWYIGVGTSGDNLNTSLILDTCNITQCQQLSAEINSLSVLDSMDLILLVDNSRSIVTYHFEEMKEAIANLISNVNLAIPNSRFAVVQFAGLDQFEVTIPFTYDPEVAYNFTKAFDGGDSYIGEAVMDVLNEISIGNLALRDDITFEFLIFTDAIGWKFISLGYDPYNIIKQAPFQAITSTIRYNDWPLDNPIAASTTSFGGHYYGPLDQNQGDPDGSLIPRRYYNPDEFDDPLDDLISDILQYNLLQGNIGNQCENPIYEWYSIEPGEILQNSESFIETNGKGSYVLNIACNDFCIYPDTFEYTTILPTKNVDNRPTMAEKKVDKVLTNEDSLNEISSGLFLNELKVIPTLSSGVFKIDYTREKSSSIVKYIVLDINGNNISNDVIPQISYGKYHCEIDLTNYADGVYYLRVVDDNFQANVKIVKIHQ